MQVTSTGLPLTTDGSKSLRVVSAEQQEKMRDTAQALEASFLSEMLKYTGLGENKSEFSGGVGEEQFSSFLREEQASEMAKAGGIGLAETIFNSMLKRAQNG
ncbi:rod-binding protein [Thioclava sp. GXIMD2076]|uniref:Rod-binding protein n=1 Tax=Thioclava kandeliae TaxID=3070818 RepID=A0ABV1SLS4_9RHOB